MEDETPSTPKTSPVISAVAVLALGVAAVATALGVVALKKIQSTTNDISERIEKNAAVELETKKLSDRVDSLALQLENIKGSLGDNSAQIDAKVGDVVKQTQKVVNILNSNIGEIRAEVVKNREAIEKLAARPTSTRSASRSESAQTAQTEPKPDTAQNSAATETPETSADGKIHRIQNGDTFAKLAKKYNVSVEAIVKANPDANPARLKIGQKVRIP